MREPTPHTMREPPKRVQGEGKGCAGYQIPTPTPKTQTEGKRTAKERTPHPHTMREPQTLTPYIYNSRGKGCAGCEVCTPANLPYISNIFCTLLVGIYCKYLLKYHTFLLINIIFLLRLIQVSRYICIFASENRNKPKNSNPKRIK